MTNLQSPIPAAEVAYPQVYGLRNDEIDLRELIKVFWQGKWFVIACAMILAILAAVYAVLQPNVYKAEALLAPANEGSNSRLAGLVGQFGGLASLAGINLPAGKADQATLAIEVLKSRAFIQEFVRRRSLVVPLIAAKGWDAESKDWKYDVERYDPQSGQWFKVNPRAKQAEPTDWELYKAFSGILDVSRNKETGLVSLSISSYSPEAAKQWIDWLVADLNAHMRAQDVQEAEASIAYLEEQIQKTTVANMQQVFYQLIEEQAKRIMLANVSAEYVFKTVDPATVPEEKDKPKRALIVLIAGFVGGFLSLVVLLGRHALRSKDTASAVS